MSNPAPGPQCRICGVYLRTQAWPVPLLGMPQPLLPGDIPARHEVCDPCQAMTRPLPEKPYTVSWDWARKEHK